MQKIPLILTRPAESNAGFAAEFPTALAEKLEFVDCPLIEIVPLAAEVYMPDTAAVIFSSSNAIGFAPAAKGRRAYCVGERTTQAAKACGWDATFAGVDAQALKSDLLSARPDVPLFHLSGVHVRGDIAETLTAAGLQVTRMPLYDQVLLPLSDAATCVLESGREAIVPLFSPRAGGHFDAICPVNAQVTVVAISDAVAETLGSTERFTTFTAAKPTSERVIECVEKAVERISLG